MAALVNTPPNYWAGAYALLSNEASGLSYRLRRELKKRGMLNVRATLPVLTGNPIGSGGAVVAGYNRIQYGNTPFLQPGGVQPVENVSVHSGVTTAADEAQVDNLAIFATQPAYVRNADGNPRGNNGG